MFSDSTDVCLHMVNAESTRVAFLGLIDRPPLTDQLLARPPFRFILDIDQFSSDDLNPSKFNDKNSKVAFLDSLLQILNDGSLDNVKSSKIVAGKEPELTNLMLIKLAEQARAHRHDKKSSRRSSVYQRNSEIPLKTKHRSKSKELKGENSKTHDKNKHAGEEEKKTEDRKKRSKSKDRKSHDRISNKKIDEGKRREKSNHAEKRKKEGDEKNRDINSNLVKHQAEQEVEEQKSLPSAIARPQTALGRPGTAAARPAPPRLKRKQIATVEKTNATPAQQTAELISESAPPAPNETFLVEDDEEVEKPPPDDSRFSEVQGAISEQGGLVRKIIDTTAEFEVGTLNDATEIHQGEFAKEKTKSEALLNALQEVTRTANPLSRIFEFAQEDLESMVKELEKWRNETKKYETLLEDKEAQGIGETHKLWKILNRLDEELKDIRLSVTAAKARIIANNERIHEMLNNI
ncbi:unnamed protein product [Angiostrongylus costaricensis]|uniref:TRAF3-interacting protein 1 n=1 Tax=Angiostrongylus costaricensis TaxID=334426 RepID=A0A0R3PGX5_ANGCS|nr:unnamed protein product [Angiostrongylus costaricensis]